MVIGDAFLVCNVHSDSVAPRPATSFINLEE